MGFVESPNIPEGPVSLAVVDGRIQADAQKILEDRGIRLLKTDAHPGLCVAVAFHPDMQLHHLGDDAIVYAPQTSPYLIESLTSYGFTLIEGVTRLNPEYPYDIPYNVARVGRYAFHNSRYTDPVLLRELERRNVKLINVKQGYSKCSVAVLNEKSIVTADKRVAEACASVGIDVLLTDAEQGIMLPGMDYGFIGGAGGLVGKSEWFLSGNPLTLGSYEKIHEYLGSRKIQLLFPENITVIDIGSVIPLCI